ncbi:MAG: hypothetical protein L6V93_09690 [Clostridiales bacterium]|nr:MAG: hypothetical protein L6V93_09690 [Clostridiales bacterium]
MFLLKTDLSDTELMKIAKNIGADVPFCVVGNTYLAEGIGEIFNTRQKAILSLIFCVLKPPFSVSTPSVYKSLVLDENTTHPDIDKIKKMRLRTEMFR